MSKSGLDIAYVLGTHVVRIDNRNGEAYNGFAIRFENRVVNIRNTRNVTIRARIFCICCPTDVTSVESTARSGQLAVDWVAVIREAGGRFFKMPPKPAAAQLAKIHTPSTVLATMPN